VRNIIGGTLFREPIICNNIPRRIPHWTNPIIVARHAFGDQFAAVDVTIPEAGRLELSFTGHSGERFTRVVHDYPGPGIAMGMYNHDESVTGFARASMSVALARGLPLYLGTKNTALKTYDQRFKDVFAEVYAREFEEAFTSAGIFYEHRLIDELAAFTIKSSGGFVCACKNHDGDVQSDIVAEGYGSLGLMTSMLVAADGRTTQTEAAHGTITRHYREHQAGRETSTNPVASIFAWTRALSQRGKLDDTPELVVFADRVEAACIRAIESGVMTKDLALLHGGGIEPVTTRAFIGDVAGRLRHDCHP
jgi:isocitrate dehydrogenase